jgi:hypothetical protein
MVSNTMRRVALILGLLLCACVSARAQPTIIGPAQTAICNQVQFMAAGPTTITQIVAGKAGQSIFVCGWHVTNTGTTGTFSIQISTSAGANCGGAPTTIIPAVNVTSSAPSADHIEYAWTQVPAGQSICITPSVATISAVMWFSQF